MRKREGNPSHVNPIGHIQPLLRYIPKLVYQNRFAMLRKLTILLILLATGGLYLFGQPSDCVGAIVICDDGVINFTPTAIDNNDFADPDNDPGCLLTDENRSVWYYFQFADDMPPNSFIEFTIDPTGGFGEDYDFAIYGPNVRCDSLGEPKRCSFANFLCAACPQTGLGNGATDTSEGAMNEDGFVAPMMVQPGQGFFMILDNWYGSSDGFQLTWGGTAAPYLRCDVNPQCSGVAVQVGPDLGLCAGSSGITLAAQTVGFGAGTQYAWTSQDGADTLLNNTGILHPTLTIPSDITGSFSLKLTAQRNGCEASDSIMVAVNAAPVPSIAGPAQTCPDQLTTLDGGPGFAHYTWSNGDTTQTTNVVPGTQNFLEVMDSIGCTGVDSFMILAYQVDSFEISGSSLLCTGDTIQLEGPAGYSGYLWSNSLQDSLITINAPGDYSLIVTDANGCQATDTLQITEVPLPIPMITGVDFVCTGTFTTLDAGSGYESYEWSNNLSSAQVDVTNPGDYQVTVTDANGCTGSGSFTLGNWPLPMPVISGSTTLCTGSSIVLDASPGFTSYLWSNGADTSFTSVNQSGMVSVSVVDANGCVGDTSVQITQVDPPNFAFPDSLGFCSGSNATIDGPVGNYTYLWSDNSDLPSLVTNTPDTYGLTITDTNGCQGRDSVIVSENQLPTPTISAPAGVCDSQTVTLTVNESYENYAWSVGGDTPSITINQGGNITVSVTDANGCVGSSTLNLPDFPTPTVSISGTSDICAGNTSILDAGPGFVAYNWTTGETGQTIQVDASGQVGVEVTDANGCTASDLVTIVVHPNPVINLASSQGFCEGTQLILDPGSGFTSYFWSDMSNGSTLTVNQPGNYEVTVTDANGCRDSISVDVSEYSLPVPVISSPANLCAGNQAILGTVSTWQSYQWSTMESTAEITISTGGNYSVTVTDANGCQGSGQTSVNLVPSPQPDIAGATKICPNGTTVLDAGAGYQAYLWSGGTTNQTLQVGQTGPVSVEVMDVNGCMGSDSVMVDLFHVDSLMIPDTVKICQGDTAVLSIDNVYTDYLWSDGTMTPSISIDYAGDLQLEVTDTNGCHLVKPFTSVLLSLPDVNIDGPAGLCQNTNAVLEAPPGFTNYLWSTSESTPAINISTPGNFEVTVTDANQCQGMASLLVQDWEPPTASISGPDLVCPNDTIVLSAIAGNASILWSTGDTVSDLPVTMQGLYSFMATDTNGCSSAVSLQVEAGSAPNFDLTGSSMFCEGGSTVIMATGNYPLYTWSNGQTGPQTAIDQPGTVTVRATNNQGCTAEETIDIEEITLPDALTGQDVALDCHEPGVVIGLPPIGGPDSLMYLWTGPGITPSNANSPQPEINIPGWYSLVVTNSFGCNSLVDSVFVDDQRTLPEASVIALQTIDCNHPETLIDGSMSATGPDFSYQWIDPDGTELIGQTGNTLTVNTPGVYQLIVTNNQTGCIGQASTAVLQNITYPELDAGDDLQITCNDPVVSPDASFIQATGQGPYEIFWRAVTGAISGDPTVLFPEINEAGTYVFEVENQANGCLSRDTIIIVANNQPPVADAGVDMHLDCVTNISVLDPSGSSSGPDISYQWVDAQGTLINGNTISTPGLYSLIVYDAATGCQATDEVQVSEVEDRPRSSEIDIQSPACFGESTGVVTLAEIEGGTPPIMISFNDQPFTDQRIFGNLTAGAYPVIAEDANGCQWDTVIIVNDGVDLDLELGDDQFIELGDAASVEALLNIPSSSLASMVWTIADTLVCNFCNSYQFSPHITSTVVVQAQDPNGCRTQDVVTIYVDRTPRVFIPNVFSPNGDGINDEFIIFGDNDVLEIKHMEIAHRWGGIVFSANNFPPNDPAYGWDGRYDSREFNASVFVYMAEIEFIDGSVQIFKGDVTILR